MKVKSRALVPAPLPYTENRSGLLTSFEVDGALSAARQAHPRPLSIPLDFTRKKRYFRSTLKDILDVFFTLKEALDEGKAG